MSIFYLMNKFVQKIGKHYSLSSLCILFFINTIFYGCILASIFLTDDIFGKIYFLSMALVFKTIHIGRYGMQAQIYRNNKHISTDTSYIFFAFPFIDTIQWKEIPNEKLLKKDTPQLGIALPYKDQTLYQSPFEMFLRTYNQDGVEIRTTLELHTTISMSYNTREKYTNILHEILEDYTRHTNTDFLLTI